MSQDIIGVNKYTNASGTRNTLEDYSVPFSAQYPHEGIISGLTVKATSPASTSISIDVGEFAIDTGSAGEFLIYRLDTAITALAVPNTGSAKYYLVCAKVDTTNATIEITVEEGTAGTDPDLTEGSGVYYLPLARIEHAGGATVANSEIVQDGSTETNNANVEIIGRITSTDWRKADETWTYAGASSPEYTFTIEGDKTAKYQAGMRLKLNQPTDGTKFFLITDVSYSSPDTTITIYGGTDYDLDNEAITEGHYSTTKAPFGFPLNPDKWTVETKDSSTRSQATPTSGTWYNLGSLSIDIPAGAWNVSYCAYATAQATTSTVGFANMSTTLSTANNSQSDSEMTAKIESYVPGTAQTKTGNTLERKKFLELASKTTYYLNGLTDISTISSFAFDGGSVHPTIIRATSAYI